MTEYDLPVAERHPYLWGDPATAEPLPTAVADALAGLGAVAPPAAVAVADAEVPERTLPAEATAELVAALGEAHVVTEHDVRVGHTRGFSTPDLLRLRRGDASDAPDAVLFPGAHDEIVRLLEIATHHRIAVVPYAGGTSVVGGLTPVREGFAGVVALDLRRLDRLVSIDPVSRTAVLQAGLRGVRAEQLLGEQGFTLGHFPQSYEMATIGGYAAARSAGQSSAGYGRFDEMVVGLTVATPRGTLRSGHRTDERHRARPAPARPGLGGRVRGDHLGDRADPAAAGRARLRGLAVRVVRRRARPHCARSRRTARCRPCCGSRTRSRPQSTSPTRARP